MRVYLTINQYNIYLIEHTLAMHGNKVSEKTSS